MGNRKYKVGQLIYEVAMSVLNDEPRIKQHEILYVGETAVFAKGCSAEWGGGQQESSFSFYWMDKLDRTEMMRFGNFCTWTDSLEKAEQIRAEACQILENRTAIIQ